MTAVIAFTERAAATAEKIDGGKIYVFYKYAGEGQTAFTDIDELRKIIVNYKEVVFICACGIAVRIIAPIIKDKTKDFAVVVCDEYGKFAVSLLSGHLGGANELAEKVASELGGQAVITTATDVNHITAIDVYAKENGLEIGSMKMAKEISVSLLRGERVGFKSDFNMPVPKDFTDTAEKLGVYATYSEKSPFEHTLRLYKKSLIVGIGCKKNTSEETADALLKSVFDKNSLSLKAVKKIATIDIKKNEPAVSRLAEKYNADLEIFDADTLNAQGEDFSHSDFVFKTTGTGCVCERAVCAAGGKLIVKKQAENGVTVAVGVVLP